MATTEELIASAKTKLQTIIDGQAAAYVDYKIGDKSVSKSQYVKYLLDVIERLSSTAVSETQVDLDFVQFDSDIDLSGDDQTQFTVL